MKIALVTNDGRELPDHREEAVPSFDEFARRLAAAGVAKARCCFHPHAVARRHLEIYHEILGQTPPIASQTAALLFSSRKT